MSYVLRISGAIALGLAGLGLPSASHADVTHTIARGHTIEAIAHRYHVSVKAILDANHLKDPKHLKIGETLTIPGVTAKDKEHTGKDAKGKDKKPQTYAMRAKTPGVVHATRVATSEDFTVRVADRRGKASPTALKSFEKMLRSAGGQAHPIDGRLVSLVAIVSNHFGSRRIEVVSGFRPYSPTQYTAHSNHNVGRAIDFRIPGVPNEVLRDYCRTLKNVGVGYYPNSTFVHLDARDTSAFWIDYSKPGEAPRYNAANVDADEGTSDVAGEPHPTEQSDGTSGASPNAPPATAPSAEPASPSPSPAPSGGAGTAAPMTSAAPTTSAAPATSAAPTTSASAPTTGASAPSTGASPAPPSAAGSSSTPSPKAPEEKAIPRATWGT